VILILAVVQGITEWLPVSSSGHLVVVQGYLGLKVPLIFDVALHVGTLCVVLMAFREDVVKILKALIRLDFRAEEGKLALFIVMGSLPTAVIGFLFHNVFEALFYNVLAVGIALLINGFLLYVSGQGRGSRELGFLDSLLIGTAQGVAITPGFSRSGFTIATGLLMGVKKEVSFVYSFLLSMPAVVGATIVESKDLAVGSQDMTVLILGVVTSIVVGYVSLKILFRMVMKERFHLFAYYCWIAGAIIIVFQLFQ